MTCFAENSVIDVYSLDRHACLYSFYLPNYIENDKEIRDLKLLMVLLWCYMINPSGVFMFFWRRAFDNSKKGDVKG